MRVHPGVHGVHERFLQDHRPKGQLFLTLLPYPLGSNRNSEWEEVYIVHECQAKSRSRHLAAIGPGEKLPIRRPRFQPHDRVRYRSPHACERRQSCGLPPGGLLCPQRYDFVVCMPIAYFQGTGSIVFNTSFKHMGGPKFGTGPGRNELRNLWPIASHVCPVCRTDFPAGLHICHSCAKPIHYPDGIFYADLKDEFGVE